ncbi:hypothetical protein KIN20_004577 [Parelaphostrongylus tenuis]|uniref:Uncharacterized protein n=1 Tax=Parelaphostrongylus tenuis TaxID=148309 RepID=A0AAD5MK07_PARTN|nr:hypothetical protein KIN20_004577 [Parelaphostrongylus tenuis]
MRSCGVYFFCQRTYHSELKTINCLKLLRDKDFPLKLIVEIVEKAAIDGGTRRTTTESAKVSKCENNCRIAQYVHLRTADSLARQRKGNRFLDPTRLVFDILNYDSLLSWLKGLQAIKHIKGFKFELIAL